MNRIGKNNELLCPMPLCEAELCVAWHSCAPVYGIEPPWPGAGESTGTPDDAVTSNWEVECTDGHTVFTWVDQTRMINQITPDADLDETADNAPPFDRELLLMHLADLKGGAS